MSQIYVAESGTILPSIETITGDVGGPVGPDGAGNINLVGDTNILVDGNPATNTLTISLVDTYNVTVTTNDVTPTILFTHTVDEGEAVIVTADIIAAKADYSAAIGGTIFVVGRRPVGDPNVTLVPVPQVNSVEDSATGDPEFDGSVAGDQILILVAGEAGITYNWKGVVRVTTQDL